MLCFQSSYQVKRKNIGGVIGSLRPSAVGGIRARFQREKFSPERYGITNPSHCTLIQSRQIYFNQMSDIVDVDQWQCRSCDRVFDTRGMRDYHHRKEHQQFVTTHGQSQQPVKIGRSTSKVFSCPCGKKFSYVQGLQRHTKSCTGTLPTVLSDSEDDHTHEAGGTSMQHTNRAEPGWKA